MGRCNFDGWSFEERQHIVADNSVSDDADIILNWFSQKMIAGLARDLAKIKMGTSLNKDAESRRAIFYALKKKGGVYVKCLQVLAVTQKFLDGWAGPAEMKVF
ncbi:MAG: hypothetical protein ACK5MU_00760 [Candidatus Saccharimonadales bacterium]